MRKYRIRNQPATVWALFSLLAIFIAGCGSSTSSASGSPTSTATTANCFSVAVGTLESVSGTTLLINDLRGQHFQATYTSSTAILQETSLTKTALQNGVNVSISTIQNPDNSYSARQIAIRNTSQSTFPTTRLAGGGTGAFRGCANQSRRGGSFNGTPGANSNRGGANQLRNIAGTVAQLNGDTLTITDSSGSDYTFKLTSSTIIIGENKATAADLHTGQTLSVTGQSNNRQVIAARTIVILLRLPAQSNQ